MSEARPQAFEQLATKNIPRNVLWSTHSLEYSQEKPHGPPNLLTNNSTGVIPDNTTPEQASAFVAAPSARRGAPLAAAPHPAASR
ncbi:hypothetical protein FRB97_008690 [Tulasnella sp. 331]|nr:hypothetical protein FRB97_008690 [Tulasnella sp. 331]